MFVIFFGSLICFVGICLEILLRIVEFRVFVMLFLMKFGVIVLMVIF